MNESPKITVISEIFAVNLSNIEPKNVLNQPEEKAVSGVKHASGEGKTIAAITTMPPSILSFKTNSK